MKEVICKRMTSFIAFITCIRLKNSQRLKASIIIILLRQIE